MVHTHPVLARIGQIVRKARERDGLTREELAHRARVQLDALAELECGRPGVSSSQLRSLAGALCLDPLALLGGREQAKPVPSVFLRHQPAQDFDDRDSIVLDEALEQGRALTRLRELLGRGPVGLQSPVFQEHEAPTDRPEAPAQDGYRKAREVRRWLGDAQSALGDMRQVLEDRFGVPVLVRPLVSAKVTAVGVHAGNSAAIVLNATDSWRARNPLLSRVFLAHELCHVLFDPESGGLNIVVEAGLDPKTNAAEQRANGFAAELLLPLDGLVQVIGQPLQLSDLDGASRLVSAARGHFGTPHEITANHLCNHRFIDRALREWIVVEKGPFIGQPPETSLPTAEEPSVALKEHVEAAYREGIVTDSEARAILGLDRLAPLPWDSPDL